MPISLYDKKSLKKNEDLRLILTGACSPVRMPRDNPQQGKTNSYSPVYLLNTSCVENNQFYHLLFQAQEPPKSKKIQHSNAKNAVRL